MGFRGGDVGQRRGYNQGQDYCESEETEFMHSQDQLNLKTSGVLAYNPKTRHFQCKSAPAGAMFTETWYVRAPHPSGYDCRRGFIRSGGERNGTGSTKGPSLMSEKPVPAQPR